jgi:hypothetical protein
MVGTHTDIQERKLIELALQENEVKFRLAFMTGTDAFYIATLEEGLILEVNNNFKSVLLRLGLYGQVRPMFQGHMYSLIWLAGSGAK